MMAHSLADLLLRPAAHHQLTQHQGIAASKPPNLQLLNCLLVLVGLMVLLQVLLVLVRVLVVLLLLALSLALVVLVVTVGLLLLLKLHSQLLRLLLLLRMLLLMLGCQLPTELQMLGGTCVEHGWPQQGHNTVDRLSILQESSHQGEPPCALQGPMP